MQMSTEMGLVELCSRTGRYGVGFVTLRGVPGNEHPVSTATSVPVWQQESK